MVGVVLWCVWAGLSSPSAERQGHVASRTETDRYLVEMRAADKAYRPGVEGKVAVTFEAKGEFKLNAQFPLKLKLESPPDGVTLDKQLLRREDARLADKGGSMSIGVTAAKPGTYRIAGVLSVSFCSDKTCLMEKLPLDTEVVVK